MKDFRTAKRYSKALLQLAEEQNKVDVVSKDFVLIETVIKTSRDFYLFLKSPIINTEKKKIILRDIFKNKIDELTLKFILLITDKGREMILPTILLQYRELLDEKQRIVEANIVTAIPLSEHQTEILTNKLKQITKKNVRIKTMYDSSIIGGFKVRIKDMVLDGTISYQLEKLKEKLNIIK